jgi:hypothetical protein
MPHLSQPHSMFVPQGRRIGQRSLIPLPARGQVGSNVTHERRILGIEATHGGSTQPAARA